MPPLPLGKSLKEKERQKKGAGISLPPVAGAGRIPLGTNTIGTIATVGVSPLPSTQLGFFIQLLGRATGLEAILSNKVGLALFVLAGSSAAILLSLWVGSNYSLSGSHPMHVFPGSETHASASPEDRQAAASPVSSLDYLAVANRNLGGEAPAPTKAPAQAQDPPQVKAPKAQAPATQPVVPAAQTPVMKASKPGATAGNPLSPKINLMAMKDVASGIGGKFQDIYKKTTDAFPAARSQQAPRYSANNKRAAVGSGGAFQQAKLTSWFSQRGAAMSSANSAAATASMPFDANNAGGRINAIGETGGGFKSSASPSLGNTSISPPPAPNQPQQTQNQTPYQNLIMAGIAALLIGTMLVMVAGQLVNAAQSNPESAPMLLAAAKALAAAAAAAGGMAIALGVIISQKFHQITQGLPYMIGGAIVIAKAAEVFIKAMQAGQEAGDGVNNAASSSASDALSSLSNIGSALNNNLNNNQNNQPTNNQNPQPHGAGTNGPPPPEGATGSWYTGS